jgi:hypothetical protein
MFPLDFRLFIDVSSTCVFGVFFSSSLLNAIDSNASVSKRFLGGFLLAWFTMIFFTKTAWSTAVLNGSGLVIVIGGRLLARTRQIPCQCFGSLSAWVERVAPWLIPALGLASLGNLCLLTVADPAPIGAAAMKLGLCIVLGLAVGLSRLAPTPTRHPASASKSPPTPPRQISDAGLAELLHPGASSSTEDDVVNARWKGRHQIQMLFVGRRCVSCTALVGKLFPYLTAEQLFDVMVVVDDAQYPLAGAVARLIDEQGRLARHLGVRLTPTLAFLTRSGSSYNVELMEGSLPILVKMLDLGDVLNFQRAA